MEKESDRRRHVRLLRDDHLFIQILAASESPDLVGSILCCQTMDVSSSGIKIQLDQEVPIHSEIDLWVDVKACARKFFLNGIVKWCYDENGDGVPFRVGIQLLNMPYTDYLPWQRLFDGIEDVSHFDSSR